MAQPIMSVVITRIDYCN